MKIGTTNILGFYFGNEPVTKLYLGSLVVFSEQEDPSPILLASRGVPVATTKDTKLYYINNSQLLTDTLSGVKD